MLPFNRYTNLSIDNCQWFWLKALKNNCKHCNLREKCFCTILQFVAYRLLTACPYAYLQSCFLVIHCRAKNLLVDTDNKTKKKLAKIFITTSANDWYSAWILAFDSRRSILRGAHAIDERDEDDDDDDDNNDIIIWKTQFYLQLGTTAQCLCVCMCLSISVCARRQTYKLLVMVHIHTSIQI